MNYNKFYTDSVAILYKIDHIWEKQLEVAVIFSEW